LGSVADVLDFWDLCGFRAVNWFPGRKPAFEGQNSFQDFSWYTLDLGAGLACVK
jgi:hypothetical protein